MHMEAHSHSSSGADLAVQRLSAVCPLTQEEISAVLLAAASSCSVSAHRETVQNDTGHVRDEHRLERMGLQNCAIFS